MAKNSLLARPSPQTLWLPGYSIKRASSSQTLRAACFSRSNGCIVRLVFLGGTSRKQNGSDLGKKCEGVAWKECPPNSEAEVNHQEHERLDLCKGLPST